MITERQIAIGKLLLETGLLNEFYHSVELVDDGKGKKLPAFKEGDEQYYVGPDDTKEMFAYIRQNGIASKIEEKPDGGCSKLYRISLPHRIVIFKDKETRNFDALIQKFLKVSFMKDVSFVSFNTNAYQLSREESPVGDYNFDATTFYMSIDIQIKMWLSSKMCDEDNCITYENPIKK